MTGIINYIIIVYLGNMQYKSVLLNLSNILKFTDSTHKTYFIKSFIRI